MDSSEIAAVYAEERKSCYTLLATNDPDAKGSTNMVAPTSKDRRRRKRRRARSWLSCCFSSRQDEELEEHGHFVVLGWGSSTVAVIREVFFQLAGKSLSLTSDGGTGVVVLLGEANASMMDHALCAALPPERRPSGVELVVLSGSPLDPRALAACCLAQASCCLWVPPYSTGSFDTNRRGQDAALFAALIAADSALAAASTAALADKRQRRRMSVLFPSARFVVDLALPETVPLLRRLHFGERNCKANCRSSSNTNNGAFDTTPGSGLSGVVSAVAVDRLLALACCQPTVAAVLIELISFEGSAVHLVQLAQSCSVPPLGQAFGKVFGLDSFGDAVDRLTDDAVLLGIIRPTPRSADGSKPKIEPNEEHHAAATILQAQTRGVQTRAKIMAMIENGGEIVLEEFEKSKAAPKRAADTPTHGGTSSGILLSPPDALRLEPTDLLILIMEKAVDLERSALQIWKARARKRAHEINTDHFSSSSKHNINDLNDSIATTTTSETTSTETTTTAAATEQSLLTVDATSDSDDNNDSMEMDDQSYAALCLSAAAAGHDMPTRPPPSPTKPAIVKRAKSPSPFKVSSISPVASPISTAQPNTNAPHPKMPPSWEVAVVGWRSDPNSMISLLINLATVVPKGASIACVSVASVAHVREPALAAAGFALDGTALMEPSGATNPSILKSIPKSGSLPRGVVLRHVLVASETNGGDLRRALLWNPSSSRHAASPLRGVLLLSCETATEVRPFVENSFDTPRANVGNSNNSSSIEWERGDSTNRGSWTNDERSWAGGTTVLNDASALAGALAADNAINGTFTKDAEIPVALECRHDLTQRALQGGFLGDSVSSQGAVAPVSVNDVTAGLLVAAAVRPALAVLLVHLVECAGNSKQDSTCSRELLSSDDSGAGADPPTTSLITENIGAWFSSEELEASDLSFHDISARVRARGGLLLGWQTSMQGSENVNHNDDDCAAHSAPREKQLALNPATKSRTRSWHEKDQLVVLICNQTAHSNKKGGHFSELGTRDIDGVGANNYDEPSTPLRGIAK